MHSENIDRSKVEKTEHLICPLCKKEYGEIKIKGPRLWASKGNKEPLIITEMCMGCYYTEGIGFDESEIYWRFIKHYPGDWVLIKPKGETK